MSGIAGNTRRARKCVYLEGRSGSFDPHVELCAKYIIPYENLMWVLFSSSILKLLLLLAVPARQWHPVMRRPVMLTDLI